MGGSTLQTSNWGGGGGICGGNGLDNDGNNGGNGGIGVDRDPNDLDYIFIDNFGQSYGYLENGTTWFGGGGGGTGVMIMEGLMVLEDMVVQEVIVLTELTRCKMGRW